MSPSMQRAAATGMQHPVSAIFSGSATAAGKPGNGHLRALQDRDGQAVEKRGEPQRRASERSREPFDLLTSWAALRSTGDGLLAHHRRIDCPEGTFHDKADSRPHERLPSRSTRPAWCRRSWASSGSERVRDNGRRSVSFVESLQSETCAKRDRLIVGAGAKGGPAPISTPVRYRASARAPLFWRWLLLRCRAGVSNTAIRMGEIQGGCRSSPARWRSDGGGLRSSEGRTRKNRMPSAAAAPLLYQPLSFWTVVRLGVLERSARAVALWMGSPLAEEGARGNPRARGFLRVHVAPRRPSDREGVRFGQRPCNRAFWRVFPRP